MEEAPPTDYKLAQQEITDVLESNPYHRSYDRVNFEDLINSSQLFWYSPVPDLKAEEARLRDQRNNQRSSNFLANDKPSVDAHNGLS